MKKMISAVLAATLLSSSFVALTACDNRPVLKVANWADYIDEGGDGSIDENNQALYEDFEEWYKETTGKEIRVEYIRVQDNETLYNQMETGDKFDLICPSEYMIMKLAAEDKLEELPDSFYDTSVETNYYAKNVSPFIKDTFDSNEINGKAWSKYAAGYMWGTTGFVFNPELVDENDVKTWNVFTNQKYNKKITAKDNVRDSYFAGLGMYYENDIKALKTKLDNGEIDLTEYQKQLSELMNDTSETTMTAVQELLIQMKKNILGFETDSGKDDMISGRITINYQWSGDAVYAINEAEDESGVLLGYCIPDTVSNLWFDGWVMPKGANVEAATAFINFLSMPKNAVRNMYYIGYTSCIGGQEVFDYLKDTYEAEEGDTTAVSYDLSYFFGNTVDGKAMISAPKEQLSRQLFAQYPDAETMKRCVAMKYFEADANSRANKMWQEVLAS